MLHPKITLDDMRRIADEDAEPAKKLSPEQERIRDAAESILHEVQDAIDEKFADWVDGLIGSNKHLIEETGQCVLPTEIVPLFLPRSDFEIQIDVEQFAIDVALEATRENENETQNVERI